MIKKLTQKQKDTIKIFYIKKEGKSTLEKENKILETENKSEKLAEFLENKGYPTYRTGASCGANIGEALIDFGVEGLPKYGRDGYKWGDILDENENFTKKELSDPQEALLGGILVYDKGFSKNIDRKTYGHVEIKTKDGFWSGGKQKSKAGLNITEGFIGFVYYLKNT